MSDRQGYDEYQRPPRRQGTGDGRQVPRNVRREPGYGRPEPGHGGRKPAYGRREPGYGRRGADYDLAAPREYEGGQGRAMAHGRTRPHRFPPAPPPRRAGLPGRLGLLPGRTGVIIVAGGALLGALGTVVTGGQPGTLLGGFLLISTVVASLAVEPRSAYLVAPVPPLAYTVAALASGAVNNPGGTSKTALALGAVQWIAHGFGVMLVATFLAASIAGARWWAARQAPARAPVAYQSRPPRRR